MRHPEKAPFAPPNISNTWYGPLTIRDRFWRFLGFNWAPPKPPSVKLTLEQLCEIALPNNLMATGLAPDLAPADITLTDPANNVTFNGSTDSSSLLSGLATAAPVDPTLAAQQWASQLPDSTVIALAGNAPAPAAPLTPSDLLFQSAFSDPFTNPYSSGLFGDPLQGATPSQQSLAQPQAASMASYGSGVGYQNDYASNVNSGSGSGAGVGSDSGVRLQLWPAPGQWFGLRFGQWFKL
jgi:hypothetical protein